MREFRKPLLIALIVSLGLGLGLGWKLRRDHAAQLGLVTSSRKLRVLALSGSIPASVLRGFRSAENIQVELVEEPTPDKLAAHLDSDPAIDLVTLLASQTSRALQTSRIQPFSLSELKNSENISRDFLDLPARLPTTVPFLWGALGFSFSTKTVSQLKSWKNVFDLGPEARLFLKPFVFETQRLAKMNMPLPFSDSALDERVKRFNAIYKYSERFLADPAQTDVGADIIELSLSEATLPAFKEMTFVIPPEKALIWILDLALTSGATNVAEAKTFTSYLLKPEVALEISLANHQASTNLLVETSALLPTQKPSALRRLPLTELDLRFDDLKH
jgi:putrescine transport system substrate-binding protein